MIASRLELVAAQQAIAIRHLLVGIEMPGIFSLDLKAYIGGHPAQPIDLLLRHMRSHHSKDGRSPVIFIRFISIATSVARAAIAPSSGG